MAGLAEVVADLMAKGRAASAPKASPLQEVTNLRDNPGALRMFVHVPEGLEPSPPLVVVLHGCGQTAAAYADAAGWITLSERYGFVLLCPEQTRANNPNGCFNWFAQEDVIRGSGEAASIASMICRAVVDHGLDAMRVYVTGLSAGGAMVGVMLATYPELFAAGAIIAGLPYGCATGLQDALSAMRGVPVRSGEIWGDAVRKASSGAEHRPRVAIWHGDQDSTVTPAAADALILQWTNVHGVSLPERSAPAVSRHRHRLWRDAAGRVVVEEHRITGLGHGTPIHSGGEDGCGAAAPWVLEAGVSSSLEIARSWGIAGRRRPERAGEAPRTAAASEARSPGAKGGLDVGHVIAGALKQAGLMR